MSEPIELRPGALPLLLDVVVPAYNEAATLERSIRTLHESMTSQFSGVLGGGWRITIADNASTDDTGAIADRLASIMSDVTALHLREKGRGRALKKAWLSSPAEVVAYLDVDLSTELAALPPLVAPLLSGHSDIAIGTRLATASRVVRGPKREFVSRSYNAILRLAGLGVSDAQCGFKAMRRAVAQRVLPYVEDTGWFFDTELLMIAERSGLRIHEVPVDWVDDPDSKVDIVQTALADLRGVARVTSGVLRGRIPVEAIYAELGRHPFQRRSRPGFFGQVLRFGIIGVLSTLAYAILYLLLQFGMGAQLANFLALLLTAVANTWANRRFTFGVEGRRGMVGHQVKSLLVFGVAWGLTSGSLVALHAARPDASATSQLIVLTVANLVATLLRFVAMRTWVFARRRGHAADAAAATSAAGPASADAAGADSPGAAEPVDPKRLPTADKEVAA